MRAAAGFAAARRSCEEKYHWESSSGRGRETPSVAFVKRFPGRVRGASEVAQGHAPNSGSRKINLAFSAKKLFSAEKLWPENGSRGRESVPNCPLDAQLLDGL